MRYILGVLADGSTAPGGSTGPERRRDDRRDQRQGRRQSDSVLPGVTVTISAPQMQGAQTAVTNAEGNYRFPGIPPGTYTVALRAARDSRSVVREGIRVTLGFTATLNVTMQVSGLQETVTVTGASPVVDVSSTKTSTNYDYKELASIPSARDMWAILAESPGVTMARIDVGGSAAGTQSGYRTYDARGGQNRVMIDGLVTTEGTGAIGVYVDYGAFEEVTAGTAGHGADMGQPGVQTQMMIKSGGNQYHGSVYGDYQNSSLQATNITDEQVARGIRDKEVNRMKVYYDFNADAGGYVKKDKMWWYGSYREFNTEINEPRFPVKPHQTKLRHFSGKTTFSLPSNNKVIGSFMRTLKIQPTRLDATRATSPINLTEGSTQEQRHWAWVYKAEWNKVLSDYDVRRSPRRSVRLQLAARAERERDRAAHRGPEQQPGDRTEPASAAEPPPQPGARLAQLLQGRPRRQPRLQVRRRGLPRDVLRGVLPDVVRQPDHLVSSATASASEVELFDPGAIEATLMTYSFYANDTWRDQQPAHADTGAALRSIRQLAARAVASRRPFQRDADQFAAVDDLVSWNLFGPRFGVTYDLSGQRPHGAEVQLRSVLVESEQRHLDRRQSESLAVVPPLCVDRSQRQRLLGRGRTGQPARDPGRRRQHRRRSRISRTPTRASSPAGSSASWRPTSASVPAW